MRPARIDVRRGGYFGLLALLVVIAIIAILMFSQTGGNKSYVKTVVDSRKTAQVRVSEIDLKNLHKDLRMMALMNNDRFPDEADLMTNSGIATQLAAQARDAGGEFVYVEGQKEGMPGTNVLVYITGPDDESPVMILRISGAVEEISVPELTAEMEKTKATIR